MARRTLFLLPVPVLLACSILAAAQPASTAPGQAQGQPKTGSSQPGSSADRDADRIAHVKLGQAAAPLYWPWKFTVGDSPIDPKTGQPLWAETDFDDSKWENVDLTPKDGDMNPLTGMSGYVPGWTAKGHPDYWGYAWYRIRVQVQAWPGQQLALAGPADVDNAYQVIDNGELAGQFGDFTGTNPKIYYAEPKVFPLPQAGRHTAAPGPNGSAPDGTTPGESTRVLAFRLWMSPYSLINEPDVGACTPRRCRARSAQWRPPTRCAGWN